jgi:hypothetical protein
MWGAVVISVIIVVCLFSSLTTLTLAKGDSGSFNLANGFVLETSTYSHKTWTEVELRIVQDNVIVALAVSESGTMSLEEVDSNSIQQGYVLTIERSFGKATSCRLYVSLTNASTALIACS